MLLFNDCNLIFFQAQVPSTAEEIRKLAIRRQNGHLSTMGNSSFVYHVNDKVLLWGKSYKYIVFCTAVPNQSDIHLALNEDASDCTRTWVIIWYYTRIYSLTTVVYSKYVSKDTIIS